MPMPQVPPHRLLFCSTSEGKVAIARQLEPELHIDGSKATVDDLRCGGLEGRLSVIQ